MFVSFYRKCLRLVDLLLCRCHGCKDRFCRIMSNMLVCRLIIQCESHYSKSIIWRFSLLNAYCTNWRGKHVFRKKNRGFLKLPMFTHRAFHRLSGIEDKEFIDTNDQFPLHLILFSLRFAVQCSCHVSYLALTRTINSETFFLLQIVATAKKRTILLFNKENSDNK